MKIHMSFHQKTDSDAKKNPGFCTTFPKGWLRLAISVSTVLDPYPKPPTGPTVTNTMLVGG